MTKINKDMYEVNISIWITLLKKNELLLHTYQIVIYKLEVSKENDFLHILMPFFCFWVYVHGPKTKTK